MNLNENMSDTNKMEKNIEDPWSIIESYFKNCHLEQLVRHQLESYNDFVNFQIIKTIEMFNPVIIKSENDYDEKLDKYKLEIYITFENFNTYRPQIHENNGATKLMFPQEARLRNFTYASNMTVDLNIKYMIRTGENLDNCQTILKNIPKIQIGKLPIMLKSSLCVLKQYNHVENETLGECNFDAGGYFIINGSEKTVLGQERAAENQVYCFNVSKSNKWSWMAEIKSVPDFKQISPKQINMMISTKNNGFGYGIYIQIPRIKQPLPLFIIFRALGILSDEEICDTILLDINDKNNKEMLLFLKGSIIESNTILTKESALQYITNNVMFTPINMNQEQGKKKKSEFTLEVINNDLFPHCSTILQKKYFLGYMTNKLMKAYFGINNPDDRDSYNNKRIDLCGILLNNLFRNYFNKLVKDMQKQIVREINNGSWQSTEDYNNIINLTNIYKIIKSTTIENGLKRALATGDFGIKHTNSNKVGVAQVLSRLTYISSLSHLRRINTPIDKSGKLIPPRKLHNTIWGFLCPAETPEGQSVGVVKNLSYMTHVTIPTESESLYTYITTRIKLIEDCNKMDLFNNTKVFINGCWLGVSDNPIQLFKLLKEMKYKGIINIYTSVVFNYNNNEIRVCNDAGRLTRPVFKVKNNNIMLTNNIIKKLNKNEIKWNDLLLDTILDESIVEYIDPLEQNYSLIAMKPINLHENTKNLFKYTHCEIHPSTIFGILASCIPFPEHNQSPRNTYQCLDPKEEVWMSSGIKKPIGEIMIGEKVLSFDPENMEITSTKVINHFIRKNEYPIYKLTTISGREITATEDHKFMTNNGWKTIGDMIHNNQLKIGICMTNYMNNIVNIQESQLILNETQFIEKMRALNIDETKNRKINKLQQYINHLKTKNLLPLNNNNDKLCILSRILGFLYADGSINIYEKNRNNKYNYKEFQCSFDFGQMEDAVQFNNDVIECGFNPSKIIFGTRTFTPLDSERSQTHNTFSCTYNGCFPAFLMSLDISYGKKTTTKRNIIPEWIMNTNEYSKQFIKGFQGGDGCKISWFKTIDSRKKDPTTYIIRTANTSQQIHPDYKESLIYFMTQCQKILNQNGIKTTGKITEQKISDTRVCISYTISSNHDNLINYFDTIGYAYAQTKNNKSFQVIEYLKSKKRNTNKDKNVDKYLEFDEWQNRNMIEQNGFLYVNIESIKKEPDGLISDIEVESENHSFIASQFASSNCAMGKQAMGVYVTNYINRMDKTAYVLSYPGRPLVDTRIMNMIELNNIPSGCMVVVAIMTHSGYNQEDSILFNQGSVDRGLFQASIFHTEKDEDKKVHGDEEIRCKPDPSKTKSIKFGNYDKINSKGIVPENTLVENRDVIIAKMIPIKENKNDNTKIIKYEDQSRVYRTNEETYIDKNFIDRNGDGYNFCKVRLRNLRKPVIGDKFSSRHGQKGTIGNIIPEEDMPFTSEGLKPDIIINPHAIPSRMTIAQLKETLLGKVLLQLGLFGDGTSFGEFDIKDICTELSNNNYESHGNELLYDGLTGSQIETSIFIGPCFYQRLKHMVADKQHSRSIGPMVNLTRQPAEGRSRDGGLRFGEMERDATISHGAANFTKERVYDASDKFQVFTCNLCGMIVSYNDTMHIHECKTCKNTINFSKVNIPYSCKLLFQELITMNIAPRIITE